MGIVRHALEVMRTSGCPTHTHLIAQVLHRHVLRPAGHLLGLPVIVLGPLDRLQHILGHLVGQRKHGQGGSLGRDVGASPETDSGWG